MELDTGAAVSVMGRCQYERQLKNTTTLRETGLRLRSYTGQQLRPVGVCHVAVEYEDQLYEKLPLYIVEGDQPTLLGRNWLQHIQLNWSLLKVDMETPLQEILDKHEEVFRDELGRMKHVQAHIELKQDARPRFRKARPVALARRNLVGKALDDLEAQGLVTQVKYSSWAAPIVTPLKKNGEIRVCGDFKVTVNPQLELETYPLPRIDDIYASLGGGQKFTTLDLRQAYLQMELDEASKQYMTVNTHKGLYQYERLPYGVSTAPSIFQRAMDQTLQGIPNCQVYLDDIIVTGRTSAEHLKTLDVVLQRLKDTGLRVNRNKYKYMRSQVEYCGHVISTKGIHQSPRKIENMLEMPSPQNQAQLRAFLGMEQYYSRFLPHLATILQPLHQLLCKDAKWDWGKSQEASFQTVKSMLTKDTTLTHFNPELEVVLACDSSSYGIGAVLSHRMPNGVERPIAYASRSLNKKEQKYAQLEKEALAIVGVPRNSNNI